MNRRGLTLLRHAHAAAPRDGQADFDRPLDSRGEAETVAAAQRLHALAPRLCLASTARRTLQTARHLLQSAAWRDCALREDPLLYLATADQLLQRIAAVPADIPELLVVGHNPGISELAERILRTQDRRPAAVSMQTAQSLRFELDLADWNLKISP